MVSGIHSHSTVARTSSFVSDCNTCLLSTLAWACNVSKSLLSHRTAPLLPQWRRLQRTYPATARQFLRVLKGSKLISKIRPYWNIVQLLHSKRWRWGQCNLFFIFKIFSDLISTVFMSKYLYLFYIRKYLWYYFYESVSKSYKLIFSFKLHYRNSYFTPSPLNSYI